MIWHLSTPSVTEVCVALYSFGDIFLSIWPLLIIIGAASALELDAKTVVDAEADGDDDVVGKAKSICWIMDSMRSIRSVTEYDDAGVDDGDITGSWPMADRVLICEPEPPKVVGRLEESPVSESLGFMLT